MKFSPHITCLALCLCSTVFSAKLAQASSLGVTRLVTAPVAAPVTPPTAWSCNLCSDGEGANASASDNALPIAPGSSTTCADVESLLLTLRPEYSSCGLIQATNIPGLCGCPTPAPSPAPVSYPACHVCQNDGELVTNPYGPLNLENTTVSASTASRFYSCDDIEYYGSVNSIQPDVCSQLEQVGISTLCGCHQFEDGPTTCGSATTLTPGQTTYSRIANISTTNAAYKNKPCIIDSPSVWFRTVGTGGPLTVDTCSFTEVSTKLSVFSGATCDERTCLGGNSNFDCRFTFPSTIGQTYFIAVGGYYGGTGAFKLTLSDQTQPPTAAPSAYPTSPTLAPSPYPTVAPVPPSPTATPSQYPTVALQPDCNICGSSDKRVSLPNVPIGASAHYACSDVEFSGLTGQVEPAACSVLQELDLAENCGCITPSGNDVCGGAIAIPLGQSVNGTTINATLDREQAVCASNYYTTGVWYKFAGTGSKVEVDTCKNSDFFGQLSVFNGDGCGSLQCVATGSGFCGNGGRVTLDTVVGATYYVLVHGYSQGRFELSVSNVVPPANDLCSNAASISPGQIVLGTTTDATTDDTPSSCGGNLDNPSSPGVWYHFQSSGAASRFVASTCGEGTNFDTSISVFSGSCGTLECIVANDDFCGMGSRAVWESDSVTDYYILVRGTSWHVANFQLELTEVEASPTVSPAPSTGNGPCLCEPNGDNCICSAFADTSSPSSFVFSAPIAAPISAAFPAPIPAPRPPSPISLPSAAPVLVLNSPGIIDTREEPQPLLSFSYAYSQETPPPPSPSRSKSKAKGGKSKSAKKSVRGKK